METGIIVSELITRTQLAMFFHHYNGKNTTYLSILNCEIVYFTSLILVGFLVNSNERRIFITLFFRIHLVIIIRNTDQGSATKTRKWSCEEEMRLIGHKTLFFSMSPIQPLYFFSKNDEWNKERVQTQRCKLHFLNVQLEEITCISREQSCREMNEINLSQN